MEDYWAWVSDTWNATAPFRVFLWEQREWLFSGIGATAITASIALISRRNREFRKPDDLHQLLEAIVQQSTHVDTSQQPLHFASGGSKPAPPKLELKTPTEAERLAFDREYQELMKNVSELAKENDDRRVSRLYSSMPEPLASLPPSRAKFGTAIFLVLLFTASFLAIRLTAFVVETLLGKA